jgi:putative lipoic acid-binding regulatory protein
MTESVRITLALSDLLPPAMFAGSRQRAQFSDVTLASSDGVLHRAHRIVLAANSGFFSRVLGELQQERPVLYMRGVESSDLGTVLDLLYLGRVEVRAERFEQVDTLAEELQIRGLVMENGGQKVLGEAAKEIIDVAVDVPVVEAAVGKCTRVKAIGYSSWRHCCQ